MKKIGLFYASNTGATEKVAQQVQSHIGPELVDALDIYKSNIDTFAKYNRLILGVSTLEDGQLQDDWSLWLEGIKNIDFSSKKVALFGLSDQYIYDEWFSDAMGVVARIILNNGGEIIGEWSTKGYKYKSSKAEMIPGKFVGLPIDEHNQWEITEERIESWSGKVLSEFSLEDSNWETSIPVQ